MENIMGKSEEAKKKSYAYRTDWDRSNTRRTSLKFNNRTDADIIDRLDKVGNVAGYIKQLIREDIARHPEIVIRKPVKEVKTEISDDFTEPE